MMGGMADHFPASNTARAKHLTEAHPEIVQIPPGDYDLVLPLLHNIAHRARQAGRDEAVEQAFAAVPCVCIEAYWKRNLEDPQCHHHDLARELEVPERSPHPKTA